MILLLLWIFPFSLADPYPFQWNSGGQQFTCKDLGSDWHIAGESCFYPYTDIRFNFSSAGQFCQSSDLHFSVAAIVDNWLVARSLQSSLSPQLYWTGLQINSNSSLTINPLNSLETIYNPLWAADQPPNVWNADKSCVALDFNSIQSMGWRLVPCTQNLPILCQTFACFQDEFRCKDNSRCIPLQAVNDGFYDCQDRSDESTSIVSISRAFSQEDCRHVYLKGSGEFSSSIGQNDQSCRWDIEAVDGQVLAFTIEGSTEGLTVNSNKEIISIPITNSFSQQTNSNFLTFRQKSQNFQRGIRVKFYSTAPNPCEIVDGVAEYNSVTIPFDCSFQASAPIQTQFLLFMTESMSKTQSAVVNVTGAGYSFSFTGADHSQAVVVPTADAVLSINGAWRSKATSSFRIRVIPFGSTCLVIPLTIPALSLHWPQQPAATFVPHCLSFVRIGKIRHTWRVDNIVPTRADSAQLTTKESEISLNSPCSYRAGDTVTLGIKQLSPDFSISFKVSDDCTWMDNSYSWSSELSCVAESSVNSVECQLGGVWSISPSICFDSGTAIPPQKACRLDKISGGYPVDGNLSDALNFRCNPGNVANKNATCNNSTFICTTYCIDGQWNLPFDSLCICEVECLAPGDINGSIPKIDTDMFSFNTTIYYTIPAGSFSAVTPKQLCENSPFSPYELTWKPYGFDSITLNVCLSYPLPYGRFEKDYYAVNEKGNIICAPGYFLNYSPLCQTPIGTNPPIWDRFDVNCTLITGKCENGIAQILPDGTTWICNCVPPYQAKGSPGNQFCELSNPCEDGTHLCDNGISCIYDRQFSLGYTCACPPGTLWTSKTINGLIANVSCVSPCRIQDLNLITTQFLWGYTDPPGNMNLTLYCKKEVNSLGGATAYIGSKPQTCMDMKNGIIDDPCQYTYPKLLAPFSEERLNQNLSMFDENSIFCENRSLTVTGFSSLFCSTSNYSYFYPRSGPFCELQSCPSLNFLPDWVTPSVNVSTSIGTNITFANCSPKRISCTWQYWLGHYIPGWDTASINCTMNGTIYVFPPPPDSNTSSFPATVTNPSTTTNRLTTTSSFGSTIDTKFATTTDPTTNSFGSTNTHNFHTFVSSSPYISTRSDPFGSPFPFGSTFGSSTRSTPKTPIVWPTEIHPNTIPHIHSQITTNNQSTLIPPANCKYNLNSCSNGLCDYRYGGCSCSENYIFDRDSMQCVLSPEFFWCSSKGNISIGLEPSCECSYGFGSGGHSGSKRCINAPLTCTCEDEKDNCSYTTYLPDGEDFLQAKCIQENIRTLKVDGISGDCACQHGVCKGEFGFNSLPCVCYDGYVGELCQVSKYCQNITEYNQDGIVCYNGGTCNRDYENCTCPPGWTGSLCKEPLETTNHCISSPCSGNGKCLQTSDSYFCQCNPGFTGQNCETSVNYCDFFNPCVNGECTSKTGEVGVQCPVCELEFNGTYCSDHTQIICSDSSYCGPNGCRNMLYPDYLCVCDDNYEPAEGTWSYNNKNCAQLIDYCSFGPCVNGICSADSQSGFACDCSGTGFNGKYCDNDTCAGYNCNSGTCVPNGGNGVICKCPPNYTGSNCENEIHNCTQSVNCFNGNCVPDGFGGGNCSCFKGYEGLDCSQKMNCSEMGFSCQNGGTCLTVDRDPGYNCTCPTGVSGKQCEILGATCSESYCNKRGNCTIIGYTAVCSCLPGYTGDTCQFDMDVSYDLLWTGYPSNQRFVSQQFNTTWFKEFTLCGWVLYAPNMAVKSTTQLPPFMGITTGKAVVLSVDNQGVVINGTRTDLNVPISALQWNHVCLRSPKYNSDRPTWAYFLNGNLVKNTTEMSLPQNNYTLYMVELDPSRGFQGELSLIQMFSVCLTEEDVATLAYDCTNASQNTQLNEDLLIGWKDFTRLDRANPGVAQLQPGICDVSTCLPGRPCGSKDKIPPVAISCPEYILKVSSSRLTAVVWDSPIFQDNIGVTSVTSNFRSGQAFPWGYYNVIYTAKDEAGNTATCQFAVMVAPNNCSAEDPAGGVVNTIWVEGFGKNSLMTAQVTCHDSDFPKVDPAFFVCDVLGQWDRISSFSPGNPYNFPSCGNTTNPTQFINGTLIANGTSCADIYNTLNSTLSGICNDPNCITIVSPCNTTTLRAVKRAIHDVVQEEFYYTIVANNTREVLLPIVNNSVSTAFPDSQSTVAGSTECDDNHPKYILDGNQNSCGDCAPGTWWNGTSCNDCPVDTYREHGPISACIKCQDNHTTGGVTKAPSAKMCYQICEVGSYYDFSMKSCLLCPFGTYQDSRGRTECIPCPLYYTTTIIGESTLQGCCKTCPVGQQIASDGTNNCEDCPLGTYKNVTIGPCAACPIGRTTSGSGKTQGSQCNIMNCPPNTYQGNYSNPLPPNAYVYQFCPSCPMGTYQNLTNQTSCLPCPSEDIAPTCQLVSDCSPNRDMCNSGLSCQPLSNTSYPLRIPIYSCSSTTVSPNTNTKSSTKIIIAIVISIVVMVIIVAAGIMIWIFRDKLPCMKFMKRGDGMIVTDSDVYRAPRIMRNRTTTSTTASSKSSVEENVIPRTPEPERPRILPPPILTSRSALDALPSRRSPISPQPFTIPRISEAMTQRNLSENDDAIRRVESDDDDDDYFG